MISVYCDGGCSGNPGPGAWAFVIPGENSSYTKGSGVRAMTTNNVMELASAYSGIMQAKAMGATEIELVSDSQYLLKGLTEWAPKWAMSNWRKSDGVAVLNRKAWEVLLAITKNMTIKTRYVRGHSGHPIQELCHSLCDALLYK